MLDHLFTLLVDEDRFGELLLSDGFYSRTITFKHGKFSLLGHLLVALGDMELLVEELRDRYLLVSVSDIVSMTHDGDFDLLDGLVLPHERR